MFSKKKKNFVIRSKKCYNVTFIHNVFLLEKDHNLIHLKIHVLIS